MVFGPPASHPAPSRILDRARDYASARPPAAEAMRNLTLPRDDVRPVVEPLFAHLGLTLDDTDAPHKFNRTFRCSHSVARGPTGDLTVLHIPDWVLGPPLKPDCLDAVGILAFYQFPSWPVVIFSYGGDTWTKPIESTLKAWALVLRVEVIFIPWKHVTPDGPGALEEEDRRNTFQQHLQSVMTPANGARPKIEDFVGGLVDIFLRETEAIDAADYFKALILRVKLPRDLTGQLNQLVTGNSGDDARTILKWARNKGSVPGSVPPCSTLVKVLEAFRDGPLGLEDKAFVEKVIKEIS